MPLFHIHGLIAAMLSSLAAGGSIVCTPGFDALRFFGWLEDPAELVHGRADHAPGDPAARAAQRRRHRAGPGCASSARPPPRCRRRSWQALEETFGVPVIESYGMTEAAHQMASNPLPPAAAKAGLGGPRGRAEVRIWR